MFEEDRTLRACIEGIAQQLMRGYEAAAGFSANMERFREMLVENNALDVDWVRTSGLSFFGENVTQSIR